MNTMYGTTTRAMNFLPYKRIADHFELLMTPSYVYRPYKIIHPFFRGTGFEKVLARTDSTFSEIIFLEAEPIIMGNDNKNAAVAAQRGDAKIIVFGHNNLFTEGIYSTPEGMRFIEKTFDWLFSQ